MTVQYGADRLAKSDDRGRLPRGTMPGKTSIRHASPHAGASCGRLALL
jgi:hypothetical protein